MKSSIDLRTLTVSVIVGIIVVLLLSYASGSQVNTALFPVLAMLCGYIITGFTVGIISKGVTIIEPGLGSIMVAAVSFFAIPAMQISGFMEITQDSDWLIILMNAVVLTFIGAWLGEKFQHGDLTAAEIKQTTVDWSWIVAGTVFAIVVSVILTIIVDLIFGQNPSYFTIPFLVSLFLTGLVIALKTPRIAYRDALLSGYLTITILTTIVRLTLVSEIEIEYLLIGLILGLGITLFGAYLGGGMKPNKKAA